MALVADYSSEDEISDDDLIKNSEKNTASSGNNLLISQDGEEENTSSESEKEDDSRLDKSQQNKTKLPNPFSQKALPVPGKDLDVSTTGLSVFTNRYEQAELARSSILEKHVQMTEKHPERGTRQICFKFKKGKCHMGQKCRFFHDQSNIVNHALKKVDEDKISDEKAMLKTSRSFGMSSTEPEDDDSYLAGKKRKKKMGVSNTLIPPKQALLRLEQQRQSERPWTVNK